MQLIRILVPLILALPRLMAGAQDCATPDGATVPDGQVRSTAHFTTGDGFITITLSNRIVDPTSAGQLVSGVAFTLNSGQTVGSLGPNSANIRKVSQGGAFTDFGPSTTGWALEEGFNGGFRLCVLCTDLGAAGPSHLLIGLPAPSGEYASANRSIAANRPHNPFTAEQSTFLIYVPGLRAGSTVANVVFSFGTQDGITVGGACSGGVVRQ